MFAAVFAEMRVLSASPENVIPLLGFIINGCGHHLASMLENDGFGCSPIAVDHAGSIG